jgi:hypothetical protein
MPSTSDFLNLRCFLKPGVFPQPVVFHFLNLWCFLHLVHSPNLWNFLNLWCFLKVTMKRDVPPPPGQPTSSDQTASSILLSWRPPVRDNGSEVGPLLLLHYSPA